MRNLFIFCMVCSFFFLFFFSRAYRTNILYGVFFLHIKGFFLFEFHFSVETEGARSLFYYSLFVLVRMRWFLTNKYDAPYFRRKAREFSLNYQHLNLASFLSVNLTLTYTYANIESFFLFHNVYACNFFILIFNRAAETAKNVF